MATTNTNQQQEGAASVPAKRKPVFVKVNDLKPGTKGHNLTVKVVSSTTVLDKKSIRNSGNTRIAECLIGDDTASILFAARNDQGLYFYPFLDSILSVCLCLCLMNFVVWMCCRVLIR